MQVTRKSFLTSLFLAPLAALAGKGCDGKPMKANFGLLANGVITHARCVPLGIPYKPGDELWGKQLGYQIGDTFRFDGKRWLVMEVRYEPS